jgi:hypothetical protein
MRNYMPATVDWHNPEKTALRLIYVGILNANDVFAAHKAAAQLLDTVNHPVILISDYQAATSTMMGTLGRVRSTMETPYHPNTATIIIYVGVNPLIAAIGKIVTRVYPARFAGRDIRIVQTLEEADRIIHEYKVNTSG